jgi:alanyl-tRNA synthetase
MMSSAEIRKKFMDFFQARGHVIVPSSSIVVKNDPTLLFTNAGMNQFKDYFLGNSIPPHLRVADTQKCLRVSGKHNDLEEVGVDTYHHTMFEMLGNWSFGDYFKKEAIAWAWELITSDFKIPKDNLYVTIFEGDPSNHIPRDDEAFAEWKRWIPEDRILLGKKKDNFWEMGDSGPCGPCTEIHIDCRPESEIKKTDARKLVNADHPEVIEIWNIVFIQFNRLKDGRLESLPARHVDTGMGFERLTRIIQGKNSNYDTDIFTGTISKVEKICAKKYGAGNSKPDIAFRVIADHLRAISFTVADGQLPSNTGAGYVIRRILRRAVRYYYSGLGYKEPLLYQLVPTLATQFESVFPELKKQTEFVSKVIEEEEQAFLRTLEKGLRKMDDLIIESGVTKIIPGKEAFELFDTYGFPLDLTRLIAHENNLGVDEQEFSVELEKQKARSRAATAVDAGDWTIIAANALTEFVGYDSLESKGRIARYRKFKSKGKESFQLVLNATPFYGESGGQVGDTGWLKFEDETIEVIDTRKENELIVHITERLPREPAREVIAEVDRMKRQNTEVHHSATHLLHAALRKILGNHVTQKGSLVNEFHLRFDFSHFAKLTDDELKKIENLVNEKIRQNIPVITKEMPREDALQMGAMALFGEKYGERVRVVIIDPSYSIELCGGTHVDSTGELGFFKIKQESAVAAGVRRIEAVAGALCEAYLQEQFTTLQQAREILKYPADLTKSIAALTEENSQLRKKAELQEAKQLQVLGQELLKKVESANGVNFLGQVLELSNPDSLKKLCFDLKQQLKNCIILLASNIGGKAHIVLGLDDQVANAKNLDAPKIIREKIAPLIAGGGGGQKTLASAGGQNPSRFKEVISSIRELAFAN